MYIVINGLPVESVSGKVEGDLGTHELVKEKKKEEKYDS